MQGGEDLSVEELAANLSTYKDQLREVHSRDLFFFFFVLMCSWFEIWIFWSLMGPFFYNEFWFCSTVMVMLCFFDF